MFNFFKRRTKGAATAQTEEQLLIVPAPALVAVLLALEKSKGSPLTEVEVLEAKDKAACIVMRASVAAAMAQSRGYDDIDPEQAWLDWQAIRPSLYGENAI